LGVTRRSVKLVVFPTYWPVGLILGAHVHSCDISFRGRPTQFFLLVSARHTRITTRDPATSEILGQTDARSLSSYGLWSEPNRIAALPCRAAQANRPRVCPQALSRLEQFCKPLGRHSRAKKVALPFLTLLILEKLQLIQRFHTLSNNAEIEASAHIDDCSHNSSIIIHRLRAEP
jgi:hypothetical protein